MGMEMLMLSSLETRENHARNGGSCTQKGDRKGVTTYKVKEWGNERRQKKERKGGGAGLTWGKPN